MLEFTLNQLSGLLSFYFWPLVRISAILFTMPGFSHRAVPRRVKILLAFLLSYLLAPLITPAPSNLLFSPQAFLFLAREVILGTAIGFSIRIVFAGIDAAGEFIGTNIGLSFASFIDPQHSRPMPIFASYFSILASLLFFTSNCHLLVIEAIYQSFHFFSLNEQTNIFKKIDKNLTQIIFQGSLIFSLGLQLALPIIASQLMANTLLGMLARASPQLNVISLGFPITLLTGIFFVYLSLPYILSLIENKLITQLRVFTN